MEETVQPDFDTAWDGDPRSCSPGGALPTVQSILWQAQQTPAKSPRFILYLKGIVSDIEQANMLKIYTNILKHNPN